MSEKVFFSPISQRDFKRVRRYRWRERYPFNDKRRHATWMDLGEQILSGGSCVIHQLSHSRGESNRFYRFLGNSAVSVSELMYMNCQIEPGLLKERHVLVLGDTTSINLKSHMGRIQDGDRIGVLEDNKTPGFMAHVHLTMDAVSSDVLGLSDVVLWSRPKATERKGASSALKWSQRESYKWALGADNASRVLQPAATRTFVLDRDADNYDLLVKIFKELGDHLVIRAQTDRYILFNGQRQLMSRCLQQCSCLGTYQIKLPALDHYSSTKGKWIKRQARTATIELRAAAISIPPPTTPNHGGGDPLALYLVEAREVDFQPQTQEEGPILWRLISSHPVQDFSQAQQVVNFYSSRWNIEQLFRLCKTKGFNFESTELETFDAIQRQSIMIFQAAAKVLQLQHARGKMDAQPLKEVFDEQEQVVLQHLNQHLEGNTEKQKNPYPKSKVSWATWIIARLGGWKGYASQRPPGPITIKRGLDKFYVFLEAFQMINLSG